MPPKRSSPGPSERSSDPRSPCAPSAPIWLIAWASKERPRKRGGTGLPGLSALSVSSTGTAVGDLTGTGEARGTSPAGAGVAPGVSAAREAPGEISDAAQPQTARARVAARLLAITGIGMAVRRPRGDGHNIKPDREGKSRRSGVARRVRPGGVPIKSPAVALTASPRQRRKFGAPEYTAHAPPPSPAALVCRPPVLGAP